MKRKLVEFDDDDVYAQIEEIAGYENRKINPQIVHMCKEYIIRNIEALREKQQVLYPAQEEKIHS